MLALLRMGTRGVMPFVKNALGSLHADERAQDAFEYLLVIGGVSVAVILAVATPVGGAMIDAVITGVCNAINTIPDMNIDCTGIIEDEEEAA
jgi:Flp pilus assembly pilin Flp